MDNSELPHIDTHRHLGGCIPPWWIWQTISVKGWTYLGESLAEVNASMTFAQDETNDFHRFLDKFKILDHIKWDENLIDSSIEAVCKDIQQEELDYCWLDFSINKYMESMNWHKKQAIQFIHERFNAYLPGKVGLILSLKYESTHASQRQYAKLIEDPDIVDLLFGIDLVGDESYFNYQFYGPIFNEWNQAGKMTRTHASESQDYQNCYNAIRDLKVKNVAHGINIHTNHEIMSYAKDMDVSFDLGITSNYLTGVWQNKLYHPINSMLNFGLKVTIGTDDPVQCNTNLHNEYQVVRKLGVTEDQIKEMRVVAATNTQLYIN